MANAILNFHFDFLHTSLIEIDFGQPCCTGWHGQGTSRLLGFHFLILSGSCCQMKTGTFSSPEFYTLSLLLFKITEVVILPPGTSQEDLRL